MTTEPRFMDLARFRVEPGFRGRSAFVVQLWWLVQALLIHPSPQFMFGWRRFWWRLFGAKIGKNVLIRPSVRVTYPWKVSLGDNVWIGDRAELYSLGSIEIGAQCVISQDCYLCAGTHDYARIDFPLVVKPIKIEGEVWIASGCFIAPGVTVGHGALIAARSLVLEDMPGGMICAGHPAKPLKERPLPQS